MNKTTFAQTLFKSPEPCLNFGTVY